MSNPARRELSDPKLIGCGHFDIDVNAELASGLGPDLARSRSFTVDTLPEHWRPAINQTKASYGRGDRSTLFDLGSLPPAMSVEILWAVDRLVQSGKCIDADGVRTLCINVERVLASPQGGELASLVDLTRPEWVRLIRKERLSAGEPILKTTMQRISTTLGRVLTVLAYAYHRGPWWEPDLWNPQLDSRIPMRLHEPAGYAVVNFSRITTPWLRGAVKWWLSRNLEDGVYTWSTARNHLHTISWFQRYIDDSGNAAGPLLVDDPDRIDEWVTIFKRWLRQQHNIQGPNKGRPLNPLTLRQSMTSTEQLYARLFAGRNEAATALNDPRWRNLGPQYAALFRFNGKPIRTHWPDPEQVLSDAVLSRVVEHSDLLAKPRTEGGLGNEQILRVLGLLIKTGRRINEIAMLDFDPIVSIPFPDPNGHVARLRYQQTKIHTADNTILIDQEVVDLVRRQQVYARNVMAQAGKPHVDPKYLFLASVGNRNGDKPISNITVTGILGKYSTMIDLRDEHGKPVSISRTHAFRHTRATNLLNAGTPIHVAMRYMGHKSPAMFMHYAQTLSTVAEHEFLRYKKVTSDGRDFDGDPATIYESIALDKRTDRVLPNGYCTLPPRQVCDKGNACLACTKFVTDASFTEALQRQRAETTELISRRQAAHTQRFGEAMDDDNIWLHGRTEELRALNAVLISLEGVRNADGSITALRGAGAPQHRPKCDDGEAP